MIVSLDQPVCYRKVLLALASNIYSFLYFATWHSYIDWTILNHTWKLNFGIKSDELGSTLQGGRMETRALRSWYGTAG